MTAYLQRSTLSSGGLSLKLTNDLGQLQDAACVMWTVQSDYTGKAASGLRLKAVRKAVGQYYAPWFMDDPTGAYKIIWEYQREFNSPLERFEQRFFVVDLDNATERHGRRSHACHGHGHEQEHGHDHEQDRDPRHHHHSRFHVQVIPPVSMFKTTPPGGYTYVVSEIIHDRKHHCGCHHDHDHDDHRCNCHAWPGCPHMLGMPPSTGHVFEIGDRVFERDIGLRLIDRNGYRKDAHCITWSIEMSNGRIVTCPAPAIRLGPGEYGIDWTVGCVAGEYLVRWVWKEFAGAPAQSIMDFFQVLNPLNPKQGVTSVGL